MTWTREDVQQAEIGEILWMLNRLNEQRENEAAALKKAYKQKG